MKYFIVEIEQTKFQQILERNKRIKEKIYIILEFSKNFKNGTR